MISQSFIIVVFYILQIVAAKPFTKVNDGKISEVMFKKYEFVLIFDTEPIEGINHGVATSMNLNTTILMKSIDFEVIDNILNEQKALWVSTLTSFDNSTDTWTEEGNITVMTDTIYFTSLGSGHAFNGPYNGDSYGGITYQIIGGTGIFDEASGIMVDTFVSTFGQTTFDINVWGIFWIPI